MCTSTSSISTLDNRCCILAFRLHNLAHTKLNLRNIKILRAHIKLTVYGRKQASKHTHAHMHNEVMLVWGSLRLAPKIIST